MDALINSVGGSALTNRLADNTDLMTQMLWSSLSLLLVIWCRAHDHDPNELLSKCDIVLQRFRNGECDEDRVFGNL